MPCKYRLEVPNGRRHFHFTQALTELVKIGTPSVVIIHYKVAVAIPVIAPVGGTEIFLINLAPPAVAARIYDAGSTVEQ